METITIFFPAANSQPGIFLTHFLLRILRIVCHVYPLLRNYREISYSTKAIARERICQRKVCLLSFECLAIISRTNYELELVKSWFSSY
jgi:hypothetical protein